MSQVLVDLDDGFLRRVFGVGFVLQQGEKQKIDGALARTDEVMKQLLFAGKDAADALGFELRIGQCHPLVADWRRARGGRGLTEPTISCRSTVARTR